MSKKKNKSTEVEETTTTTAVEEETTAELNIEKLKLKTEWSKMLSEEYIKQWLKNILDEVMENDNLVFQWLFIMYLEDMLSKVR